VLKPTEEEAKAMAEAAQEPPPPTPEQQYLITQAQKALAEAEKIKAEAQKIAAEFSPEMIQAKQAGEVAKIDADVEKARLQAETARVNAEVARIKALAGVEMEREKARAVGDNDGGIANVLKPAIDAMSMALADANAAIKGLAQSQAAIAAKIDDVDAKASRPRNAKVVVRKAADGSYVGERIES
jgi:F0F1-type ATP synthase membrane subunit b/b'